jgi:hypothetical protein
VVCNKPLVIIFYSGFWNLVTICFLLSHHAGGPRWVWLNHWCVQSTMIIVGHRSVWPITSPNPQDPIPNLEKESPLVLFRHLTIEKQFTWGTPLRSRTEHNCNRRERVEDRAQIFRVCCQPPTFEALPSCALSHGQVAPDFVMAPNKRSQDDLYDVSPLSKDDQS